MNTDCTKCDSRRLSEEEKTVNQSANQRGKNLEGAIVIGAVLILVLVTAVFYLKFAALGQDTDGSSNSEIKTITHH